MTTFADVWNTEYEGLPADNEVINQGANRIRDFKLNVRQRLIVDHSWAGDAEDGKHNQSTYRVQTVDPVIDPGEATDGIVYTKAVGGNTELFYRDSAGNVVQLTTSGGIDFKPFPTGTVMLFAQATPPTGWTQITSLNDSLLRVVNDGSGGGVGGSWTISGVTAGTSVSTVINSVSMSLAMNSFTIASGNLPPHSHGFSVTASATAFGSGGNPGLQPSGSTSGTTDNGPGTSTPITPTGVANFVSGTATSNGITTIFADGNWRPAYLNVLRASKN